jgi:uncharacterized membrane protein
LVVGAAFAFRIVSKREKMLTVSLIIVAVLVPYFLFQTSFVFEVVNSQSWSVSLSGYRMSPYQLYRQNAYISDTAFYGATWLCDHFSIGNNLAYADGSSRSLLISYGNIDISSTGDLSNATQLTANDAVFLGPLNVVDGQIASTYYNNSVTELKFLGDLNGIYSNGGVVVLGR